MQVIPVNINRKSHLGDYESSFKSGHSV